MWSNVSRCSRSAETHQVGRQGLQESGDPAAAVVAALARALLADLEAHRARQAAERRRMGVVYRDQDLIFSTKWGTALASGNILRRSGSCSSGPASRNTTSCTTCATRRRGADHAGHAADGGGADPGARRAATSRPAIYAHLVPRAGRTALEEAEDFYGGLERPPKSPATLPAASASAVAPAAGAGRPMPAWLMPEVYAAVSASSIWGIDRSRAPSH